MDLEVRIGRAHEQPGFEELEARRVKVIERGRRQSHG